MNYDRGRRSGRRRGDDLLDVLVAPPLADRIEPHAVGPSQQQQIRDPVPARRGVSGLGPRVHFYQEPLPELGELEILRKVEMSIPPMMTDKAPLVHAKMLARVVVAESPALAELDLREERRRPAVVGVAAAVAHLCANQSVRRERREI